MHDALRNRLLRRIEGLPEEQLYQVLDFIEFLDAKYSAAEPPEVSGLQRFAERLEDRLRSRTVSPTRLREAFQLISAADRVLGGVSETGRKFLEELQEPSKPPGDRGGERTSERPGQGDLSGLTPESRAG